MMGESRHECGNFGPQVDALPRLGQGAAVLRIENNAGATSNDGGRVEGKLVHNFGFPTTKLLLPTLGKDLGDREPGRFRDGLVGIEKREGQLFG